MLNVEALAIGTRSEVLRSGEASAEGGVGRCGFVHFTALGRKEEFYCFA